MHPEGLAWEGPVGGLADPVTKLEEQKLPSIPRYKYGRKSAAITYPEPLCVGGALVAAMPARGIYLGDLQLCGSNHVKLEEGGQSHLPSGLVSSPVFAATRPCLCGLAGVPTERGQGHRERCPFPGRDEDI